MEEEGATHEQFGRWKQLPPDNKTKLNLDHMDSRIRVGKTVESSSSQFSGKLTQHVHRARGA